MVKRKDGSTAWILTNISYIRVGDQKLFQAIIQDITEQKNAEEKLKESEEKYRILVENAEDLNKINPSTITENAFTISRLSQDSIYYIQVRTVNIDDKVGGYNTNVPFVKASPRPEFTVTLIFELILVGVDDSCAIRFYDATIMADSAMPNGGADMWINYLATLPDTVKFVSPDQHAQYGTDARLTQFVNLGQDYWADVYEVTTEPTENSVDVDVGDLVIAKTQDGNYIKIYVNAIDKVNYTVTITYAYQNIANFPHF